MSAGDYLELKILDHVVGKTAFAIPTAYLGLSTANPGDNGAGLAEPVGNNYARVTTSAANWNAAAAGSISNAQDLTFPEATGAWGTLSHFALFDAVTAGNMLIHGALGTAKVIGSGDTAKFAGGTPGDIVFTQD